MMALGELCDIVSGELHGADATFTAVSTDTRTIREGELFFALRGARFDAAEFVAQAGERGAAGAVVDAPVDASIAQVQVADTRIALADLARAWRARSHCKLIGITGSNGKTTVKELTASICRVAHGDQAVLATEGNLNNDIGLPLTLLNLRASHSVAVAEMGANRPDEIAFLAGIAAPNIAVINNVARAHIEGFGSIEVVAQTKAQLLDNLGADGTAVLNRDDAFFNDCVERAGAASVVSFGNDDTSDVRAENVRPVVRRGAPAFSFDLVTPHGKAAVVLPLAGRHNVNNALAAAAAAMAAGATLDDVTEGLATARSVPGRMRAFRHTSGAMIFDDAYNANPDSVAAAIRTLAEFKGKAWLVLGDMGELGDDAVAMHKETGRLARESGAEGLFCIGDLGKEIGAGFGAGARWMKSMDELERELREELVPGRNVLIKGSRFMGLDVLVSALDETPEGNQGES